jgi:hypothetical protein
MCALVVILASIRGHPFGFLDVASGALENRVQNQCGFRRTHVEQTSIASLNCNRAAHAGLHVSMFKPSDG